MKHHIFLVLTIIATLPFQAKAGTIVASGTPENGDGCGANCSWTLYDDGLFEISGSGQMSSYQQGGSATTGWTVSNAPWDDYITQIKSVSIDSRMTSIGAYAFAGAANLTKVDIPNSIKRIYAGAFLSSGLKSAAVPDSVSYIGDWAFSSTHDVNIPSAIETINPGTFYSVKADTFIIPDTIKKISENAFGNADITNIVLTDNTTDIASNAFNSRLQHIYCTGDVNECKANVGETWANKVESVTLKTTNGVTYIYNTEGKVVATTGNRTNKRIYTLEEARQAVEAAGTDTVQFRIKYK